MKTDSILGAIHNTPHVKINRLFDERFKVYMKLERANPGGSIKDRIALAMIEAAEQSGELKKDSVIIEPTSGNTGVGLAMVAAVKGYRLVLVMPESMSIERRRLMALYGAELELTPREKGMKGAIDKATELAQKTAGSFMPQQFNNPANPEIHTRTTAQEILNDFEKVDYLITGVGTGGHITGVSKVLKEKMNSLKVFAVEPDTSPVIGGGEPGPHPIQGIGAGFLPQVFDKTLVDKAVAVSKDDAFSFAKRLAKEEGILAGISTGASLAAIAQVASEIEDGATVLTFNYDTGERYLSVDGLF